MMFIPTQTGFMRLEDSAGLLHAIFPELSQPGTVLSRSASGSDRREWRRSEKLAMFRITAETCHAFTLAEILIMAAINNMETTRSDGN